MTANPNTQALSDAGVSIWLDDLSRERIVSGDLQALIDTRNVVGVTTNPTIFAKALSNGESYAEQVGTLKRHPLEEVIRELTTTDVRHACDLFTGVFEATGGYDGRVSIEVEPGLAMDTDATIEQAKLLHEMVDRPNVLIKIPATDPGLPAITAAIGAGISVNVTLIFSVERYRQVMDAYLAGLEAADEAGIDLSTIHSVASVFVSRIDTEVDKRLVAIGTDEALALKSRFAIANTRLSYQAFEEVFGSDRFAALAAKGATKQRPLWASTGVKDPALPDTRYVVDLVTQGVVNTMPEKTLDAVADHGQITGDTVRTHYADAVQTTGEVQRVGVDLADVFTTLEREGVDKFVTSWDELVQTVDTAVQQA